MKKEISSEEEKKLVWKLSEKPSGHVVAELVAQGVIDKQEARSILFREEVKQSDEVEALKELVKALQEMVKELIDRPRDIQYVPYAKVVEVPRRLSPYWINAIGTGSPLGIHQTGTYGGNTSYTLSVNQ